MQYRVSLTSAGDRLWGYSELKEVPPLELEKVNALLAIAERLEAMAQSLGTIARLQEEADAQRRDFEVGA